MIDPKRLLTNRLFLAIAVGVVLVAGLLTWILAKSILAGVAVSVSLIAVVLLWFPVELALRAIQARRRSSALKKALDGQPTHMPSSMRETTAAELERKFDEAITTLRERLGPGFLYENPWFLLLGEIGSGKTTSLRRSGIRWPLGGEQQGIGGTIHCDWWFANDAIILDTAGRFAVHEEGSPVEPVWKSFLAQLSKARPRKPIDGVVLAIPADSLIIGPNDDRDAKLDAARSLGARLHAKLDELQRTLNVVFPVHVLITKLDRIKGFEEFFTLLPSEMHGSLFGWSNSHALDEPFKTEWLDEAFAEVDEDLERVRLTLLERGESHANLIHLFPREIAALKPALAAYLGAAFESSKYHEPHLVRGIFFSSGRQDQNTLSSLVEYARSSGGARAATEAPARQDDDPSEQMSMFLARSGPSTVSAVPSGSNGDDSDRGFGRPYFVYDFYTKKVFRECGLSRPTRRVESAVSRVGKHAKVAAVALAAIVSIWLIVALLGRYSAVEKVAVAVDQVAQATPDGTRPTLASYEVTEGGRTTNRLAQAYRALEQEESAIAGFLAGGIVADAYARLDAIFRESADHVLDLSERESPYYREILAGASVLDFREKLDRVAETYAQMDTYAKEERPIHEIATFLATIAPEASKGPLSAFTTGGLVHRLKLRERAEASETIRKSVEERWAEVTTPSELLAAKIPGTIDPAFPEYRALVDRATELRNAWNALHEKHRARQATVLDVVAFARAFDALRNAIPAVPSSDDATETDTQAGSSSPTAALPGNIRGVPKAGSPARRLIDEGARRAAGALARTGEEEVDAVAIALGLSGYFRGPEERVIALFTDKAPFLPEKNAKEENARVLGTLRDGAKRELESLGLVLDEGSMRLRVRDVPGELESVLEALVSHGEPNGLALPFSDASSLPVELWGEILTTALPATSGETLLRDAASAVSGWYRTALGDRGARYYLRAGDFAALESALDRSFNFFVRLGIGRDLETSGGVDPRVADTYRLAQEAGVALAIARVARGLTSIQESPASLERPFLRIRGLLDRFVPRADGTAIAEGAEGDEARARAARAASLTSYFAAFEARGFPHVRSLLDEVRRSAVPAAIEEIATREVTVGRTKASLAMAFLPTRQYDEREGNEFWAAPSVFRERGRNTLWIRLYGTEGAATPAGRVASWVEGIARHIEDVRDAGELVESWGTPSEKADDSAMIYRLWASARDAYRRWNEAKAAESPGPDAERPQALRDIDEIVAKLHELQAVSEKRSYGVEIAGFLQSLDLRLEDWRIESPSEGLSYFALARNELAARVAAELRLYLAHKIIADTTAFLAELRPLADRFPFKAGASGLGESGANLREVWSFLSGRDFGIVFLDAPITLAEPFPTSREADQWSELVRSCRGILGGTDDAYFQKLEELRPRLVAIRKFLLGDDPDANAPAKRGYDEFLKSPVQYSLFFRAQPERLDPVAAKILDFRWTPPDDKSRAEICGFNAALQAKTWGEPVKFQWNDLRRSIELSVGSRDPKSSSLRFREDGGFIKLGRWARRSDGKGGFCGPDPLGSTTLRATVGFEGFDDEWYLFRILRAFGDEIANDRDRGTTDQWPRGHTLRFPIELRNGGPPASGELAIVLAFQASTGPLMPRFDDLPIPDPTASRWRTSALAERSRSR